MDHRIEREGEGEECEGTEDNMDDSFYLSSDYLRPHSRGSYEKRIQRSVKNSSPARQWSSLTYFNFISRLKIASYSNEESMFPIYSSRAGSSLHSWKGQREGTKFLVTHAFCCPLWPCMDTYGLHKKPSSHLIMETTVAHSLTLSALTIIRRTAKRSVSQ